jgi:hypothetical protein
MAPDYDKVFYAPTPPSFSLHIPFNWAFLWSIEAVDIIRNLNGRGNWTSTVR